MGKFSKKDDELDVTEPTRARNRGSIKIGSNPWRWYKNDTCLPTRRSSQLDSNLESLIAKQLRFRSQIQMTEEIAFLPLLHATVALSCVKVIFFKVAKGSLSNRDTRANFFRKGQYVAEDNFRPSVTCKRPMSLFPMIPLLFIILQHVLTNINI